ncbi:MAG: hypothetical protein LBJ86_05535 [Spirochaetaceae bacterium]|jgi:hypothetical protein|nr:hypothetical protein [Spirochaetaceae bacterium]
MSQKQMMTIHEKLEVSMKAHEYLEAGNKAEAVRILREELPMPPYLAKAVKEFSGADFLVKGRYNLSEAEAEFGPDWLTR